MTFWMNLSRRVGKDNVHVFLWLYKYFNTSFIKETWNYPSQLEIQWDSHMIIIGYFVVGSFVRFLSCTRWEGLKTNSFACRCSEILGMYDFFFTVSLRISYNTRLIRNKQTHAMHDGWHSLFHLPRYSVQSKLVQSSSFNLFYTTKLRYVTEMSHETSQKFHYMI